MAKASFEWIVRKDVENQANHGIAFVQAQHAFADPRRVIPEAGQRRDESAYAAAIALATCANRSRSGAGGFQRLPSDREGSGHWALLAT